MKLHFEDFQPMNPKFNTIDCAPNPKNLTAWEYNDGGNRRPSPGTSLVDHLY